MKLSNGLAWEYFNAGMQCSVAEESAVGVNRPLLCDVSVVAWQKVKGPFGPDSCVCPQ